MANKKKVVIIGAGFGGLEVAKGLVGAGRDYQVTVLDRRNYHLFQPLLYQVAIAGLSPAEIAAPIRSILSDAPNIACVLANVTSLDLKQQKVISDAGTFDYDFLVVACGAKHSYFGNQHWEPLAPGLKTLEQATEIRRRILLAFELAERETDASKRLPYLTFAIVGGGPTGVEMAGAIGELSRFTLAQDFRFITPGSARVILIEAGERILSSFAPSLSIKATRELERLGVQVWTNTRVTNVTEEGIYLGREFFSTKTVIWAAGVQASSLGQYLPGEKDRQNRVRVNSDLSVNGLDNVFVIGDQASFINETGNPLPGVAPVAIQQGRFLARQLKRIAKGKAREQFKYMDKGQLATIGRKFAVLQFGKIKIAGFIAWLAWLIVHIYYIIGFKNRLFILLQWTWHYISYGRGARLIVDKTWESYRSKPQVTDDKI